MSSRPLDLEIQNSSWSRITLENACVFIKDGTHGTHIRVNSGIPLLSAKNISTAGTVDWDSEDSLIGEEDYSKIHAKYELEQDDLLLTVVGTLGRRALVSKGKKYTIQRSVAALRLDHAIALPKFLFQFVASDYFQRQLVLRSNATAQAGVYLGELARIQIPIPSVEEQQRIASILTAVDDVIASTTAQINKLKDLKTGMMQELLTKGIGHTEFKDSPVGRIPKAWEVVKTGQVTKSIVPGRNKPKQLDGDIPWITISDIDEVYISKSKNNFGVSKVVLAEASGKTVPKDSVVMTVVGEFGISAVAGCELVLNQQLHAFVCSMKIFPMYLCLILRFQKTQLEKLATQTTIAYMNKENTEAILIPLPSIDEQKKITEVVLSIENSIVKNNSRFNALHSSKKALMQDLLTGKVRV